MKNVLSLFDGVSCGQIALNRLGIPYDNYYASEIEKDAIKITQKNYPNTIQIGDVFDIDFSLYKDIEIILGGSPCTFWSISQNANNRENTSDGEGFRLFKRFADAKNYYNPKYFLYENNYSIHQDIQNEISKYLGVSPIMINSSLVSCQQRKRLYWTNIPNIIQPEDKHIYVKDIITSEGSEKHFLSDAYLPKINYVKKKSVDTTKPIRIGHVGKGGQGERIYDINGKTVNLMAKSGGMGGKTGLYLIDNRIRKLSPVEAERCQQIPDNYTEGVSDTKRYQAVGNGWSVDVIAHILSFIK